MKPYTKISLIIWLVTSTIGNTQTKKWSLTACIKHAFENNISIKNSKLELENSRLNKKDAIGSFLPSISTSSTHSWSIGLNQNIITGTLENQTTQFTAVNLSSNITIYNGLRNLNQLHRSNLEILANTYQIENMKDDISLLIVNSFLQILFNKEQLQVYIAQLELSKQELNRTMEFVKAGILPDGEILELKANIKSQEQNVIDTENAVLLSRINLAQTLLINDYDNFDIINNINSLYDTSILNKPIKDILKSAKERTYNLKISETNVKLAEYDLKLAQGLQLPTLSGFYNYNTRATYSDQIVGITNIPNGTNTPIGFVENTGDIVLSPNVTSTPVIQEPDKLFDQFSFNDGHSFGLNLSIPILNGFSYTNDVKRKKINIERFKNELKQTNLDLETKIHQALNDAKGALKTFEAASSTLDARQEAFNYSRERYALGLLNAFDFNQAQNKYEEAQSTLIRAKLDYIFKSKILEFYFGIPITNL